MNNWLRQEVPRQRWFADKTRAVADIQFLWRASLPSSIVGIEMAIVEYRFLVGSPSLYFIPIVTEAPEDGVAGTAFTTWLMDSLAGRALLPTGMSWQRLAPAGASDYPVGPGRLLGLEQSNTSIRYGEHSLIKVNRRLTAGPSPEAELAIVIARSPDSSFAAETRGVLTIEGMAEDPLCVAICSAYVPNGGDAWSFLLRSMTDNADSDGTMDGEIRRIADVTVAMHIGLSSEHSLPEVAPEPTQLADIERWETRSLESLRKLEEFVASSRLESLPENSRDLVRQLPGALPEVRAQLHGLHGLLGTDRIRIHGDFHLGQVLRTPDGRYVVVDFDGEPDRPLAERREKYSALRDLAGMLRSFDYARGTIEHSVPNTSPEGWCDWQKRIRKIFLERYQDQVATHPVRLIPEGDEDFGRALRALELEKAIYECGYELSNRPDWLWLPLSTLVNFS